MSAATCLTMASMLFVLFFSGALPNSIAAGTVNRLLMTAMTFVFVSYQFRTFHFSRKSTKLRVRARGNALLKCL